MALWIVGHSQAVWGACLASRAPRCTTAPAAARAAAEASERARPTTWCPAASSAEDGGSDASACSGDENAHEKHLQVIDCRWDRVCA